MTEFDNPFLAALYLLASVDADMIEIIALSLEVSLTAVFISALIGMPLGAALALYRPPLRRLMIIILNAAMGLPPVVVGLVVYLMLSRSGPLGLLELLYSPTAMIIAQVILILPIIAALTRQIVEDLWRDYREQLTSFGVRRHKALFTLLWEARFSMATTILAGFGRASAEVGAVMIVGGNIDHYTRVMTTSIALETSKGNLSLALGLGMVLLLISLSVNAVVFAAEERAKGLQSMRI